MEYLKSGNTVIVRMEIGEEILTELAKVIKELDIKCASVHGIGGSDHFCIGLFSMKEQTYDFKEFKTFHEIVSINGTLNRDKDKSPYVHLHMAFGGKDGALVGGHVKYAYVGATTEIYINLIDADVRRKKIKETGLNLLDFSYDKKK